MNKDKFKDSLQYGICTGPPGLLLPGCRYGNPGQETKNCPLNKIEPREIKCNCCNKCRNHCGWTVQIKEVNEREHKDISEKLQKLVDAYNARQRNI